MKRGGKTWVLQVGACTVGCTIKRTVGCTIQCTIGCTVGSGSHRSCDKYNCKYGESHEHFYSPLPLIFLALSLLLASPGPLICL